MTHCKTKQIKSAYQEFLKSNMYELRHLYNNYSVHKENAFDYCQQLFHKYYSDYNDTLRILGGNCMTFSVGFTGEIPDEKTGEIKKAFFYITKNYDRYILIDELDEVTR